MDEIAERFHEEAKREFDTNRDNGLWEKCLARNEGDETKAKYAYIQTVAERLSARAPERPVASPAQQERPKKAWLRAGQVISWVAGIVVVLIATGYGESIGRDVLKFLHSFGSSAPAVKFSDKDMVAMAAEVHKRLQGKWLDDVTQAEGATFDLNRKVFQFRYIIMDMNGKDIPAVKQRVLENITPEMCEGFKSAIDSGYSVEFHYRTPVGPVSIPLECST